MDVHDEMILMMLLWFAAAVATLIQDDCNIGAVASVCLHCNTVEYKPETIVYTKSKYFGL